MTVSSPAELEKVVNGFIEKRTVPRLLRNVSMMLREDNPVATGYSRSNWLSQVNSPISSPFSTRPVVEAFGEQAAIENQRNLLAAAISRYKLGDTVFISNNVDYIGDLNKGSSPQAVSGWVQSAIKKGIVATAQSVSGSGSIIV